MYSEPGHRSQGTRQLSSQGPNYCKTVCTGLTQTLKLPQAEGYRNTHEKKIIPFDLYAEAEVDAPHRRVPDAGTFPFVSDWDNSLM